MHNPLTERTPGLPDDCLQDIRRQQVVLPVLFRLIPRSDWELAYSLLSPGSSLCFCIHQVLLEAA